MLLFFKNIICQQCKVCRQFLQFIQSGRNPFRRNLMETASGKTAGQPVITGIGFLQTLLETGSFHRRGMPGNIDIPKQKGSHDLVEGFRRTETQMCGRITIYPGFRMIQCFLIGTVRRSNQDPRVFSHTSPPEKPQKKSPGIVHMFDNIK